jgi:hypothetical protein
MAPEEVLKGRMTRIKNALTKNGIEVRAESAGWSLVQGVLSRGDSKVGTALANMPGYSLAAWRRALEECDLSSDFYVHRDLTQDEPFPWAVVNSGITPDYLREDMDRTYGDIETPRCPPKDCHMCGVC